MEKLCTDQLADKPKELIKNTAQDTDINEAWQKVKEQAENEVKTQSFDQQVKTLLKKGYPNAAGMEESQFLKYINPLEENFRAGSVIVIPENIVPLAKQMTMVELDGKTGYTRFDVSEIFNAEGTETQRKPYLMHDIEYGKAMPNTSPDDRVKKLKKQNRLGQNAQEGIAMVTHKPEILKDHYMDLPGSRYRHSGRVVALCLYGGHPRLVCVRASFSTWGWGSASCGSR